MICAVWSAEHTHTAPRWKPLKPSTVGNRMRGKMASREGGSTLHPHLSLLPPLWGVWRGCHTAGAAFCIYFALTLCVSHCTRQSIRCLLLGSSSVTMGPAWKPAMTLTHSMDVQTHSVCHDVLWMRFRCFMGKGFVLDDIRWLRGWKEIAV